MNVYKFSNSTADHTRSTLATTGTSTLTPDAGKLILITATGSSVRITQNASNTPALGSITMANDQVLLESNGEEVVVRLDDQSASAAEKAQVSIGVVTATSILKGFVR